jgi:Uri superfamily endonuclease
VEAVIAAETNKRMECTVNSYLKSMSGAKVPVNGFGASDCKKNCKSHLLFFPEIKNVDCVVQDLVKKLESSSGVVSVVVLD